MISVPRLTYEQRLLSGKLEQLEQKRQKEKTLWADVSHEIRNNTNVIVGITSALADTNLPPGQQQLIEQLDYASNSLLALVSDFLDLAALDEHKSELNLAPLNIIKLADILSGILQFRLKDKPVHVRFYCDPRIPEYLLADKKVLHQLLLNLLGNAIKFTERGHIDFELHLEAQTSTEVCLAFRIADTGVGIPEEKLDSIFERFVQVQGWQDTNCKGTGLGLPITRELTQLHGGEIEVESTFGKGTAFTVTIPFERVQPKKEKATPAPRPSFEVSQAMKVLIVEDSAMNRIYLENMLTNWGIFHTSCESGEQALELLEREQFDLILLDLNLNSYGMDGYETSIHIQNMPSYADNPAPIVAIAGATETEVREKIESVGIQHFLAKPFKPEQFFELVVGFSKMPRQQDPLHYHFSSAFDTQTLYELYRQDYRQIQRMFETFLKNTPHIISRMEENLHGENWQDFEMDAHKIKPAFAMIGTPKLGQQVRQLESFCHAKPEKKIVQPVFTRFKMAMEGIIQEVGQEVEKLASFNLSNA